MPGSSPNNRRDPRHPIRIDGRILNWVSRANACIIENFSDHGMGVSVPGAANTLRSVDQWLVNGAAMSIGFRLPSDGRPVRANASVRHARRVGDSIRIGVSFAQSNPRVLDALLREALKGTSTPHAGLPMVAAREDAIPTLDDADPASFTDELPGILDRFFPEVRDRLFARYQAVSENPADYFYGMVAVRGYERRMREALSEARDQSAGGLRDRFSKLVSELDVTVPVRELIVVTFDNLLEETQRKR